MQQRNKILTALGATALAGAAVFAIAAGPANSDSDVAITGDALQQATDAALEHTGGGTVTDTEVGDEESLYEVEVTMDDGTEIDVQLDESFTVVGDEVEGADGDEGDDTDD